MATLEAAAAWSRLVDYHERCYEGETLSREEALDFKAAWWEVRDGAEGDVAAFALLAYSLKYLRYLGVLTPDDE